MRYLMFLFAGLLAMTVGFGGRTVIAEEAGVTDIYLSHLKAERVGESRTFGISFDVVNNGASLDNLKVRVDLVKLVENVNIVKDSWVEEASFRAPQGRVSRSVSYAAPDFLGGEYDLQVSVNDTNGMLYTVNSAGTVSLERVAPYVSVRPDECYLTVDGDSERYPLSMGVDVDPEETLRGHCTVENVSGGDVEVRIMLETRWRSVIGEIVRPETMTGEVVPFASGETKDISFVLPTVKDPQAYSAIMRLRDASGTQVSDEAEFHYVMRGQSATLRQSGYDVDTERESVEVSFDWMKSADSHFQSRVVPERADEYAVLARWETASGEEIFSSGTLALDPGASGMEMNHVSVVIPDEYGEMRLTLSLVDGSGNVLDERIFDGMDRDPAIAGVFASRASEAGVTDPIPVRTIVYAVIGILTMAAFVAILLWKRRVTGAVSVLLGAVALLGAVHPVEAKTRTHRVYDNPNHYFSVTMTADLDRRYPDAYYLPGDTMTVTTTLTDAVCNDGVHTSSNLKTVVNGSESVISGVMASTYSKNVVIPTDQAPGIYAAKACTSINAWSDPYDCVDFEYEVKAKTLKLCVNGASLSDVALSPGDSRTLSTRFGTGSGCSDSADADATAGTLFSQSIADGASNDTVSLATSTVRALDYVSPLFDQTGRQTASETVSAAYVDAGTSYSDTLGISVIENCESRCSAEADQHCENEEFVTENSCQQTETCSSTYGTRDCEFNWTEPAPGM